MKFALIVPAAGIGARSGRPLPKQYSPLAGRDVLYHAVRPFTQVGRCTEIVVAVNSAMTDVAQRSLEGLSNVRMVSGGGERQDSISNALDALQSDAQLVLVHDAARPCVTTSIIERVLIEAERVGAAIPAIPVADTIKRIDESNTILETIDRTSLRRAQTPQGFRREVLVEAYAYARATGIVATDDASLVEALGHPVSVVAGDESNIKITRDIDFMIAEQLLSRR